MPPGARRLASFLLLVTLMLLPGLKVREVKLAQTTPHEEK